MGSETPDRLADKFWEEHRINLLQYPQGGIQAGDIVLWTEGDRSAFGPMPLADLVAQGTPLPAPGNPEPVGDIDRTFSASRTIEGHASVFGGLLSFVAASLARVEAEAKHAAGRKFSFALKEVARQSVSLPRLRDAVRKGLLLDGLLPGSDSQAATIHAVVDVYTATTVALRWDDDLERLAKAKLDASELVSLSAGGSAKDADAGKVLVSGKPGKIFGVRLVGIEREEDRFALRLKHTRVGVLGDGSEVESADLDLPCRSGLELQPHPRRAR